MRLEGSLMREQMIEAAIKAIRNCLGCAIAI
jgi:hypothetical protein